MLVSVSTVDTSEYPVSLESRWDQRGLDTTDVDSEIQQGKGQTNIHYK